MTDNLNNYLVATQEESQESSSSNIVESSARNDLLSIFECCICYEHATTKIFQCESGRHHVCYNCRPKVQSCPLCRGPFGESRNYYLEKIAACLKFPCKHFNNGCKFLLSNVNKEEHEISCDYRPLFCPSPTVDCRWQGPYKSILNHFASYHKEVITSTGEDISFLAIDADSNEHNNWIMLQTCHGETFMLTLTKQEAENHLKFFAAVQILASRKKAQKYIYRMELNGKERQSSWKSSTKSVCEDLSTVIEQNNCFVFDSKTAKLFAVNGNLEINVSIVKLYAP